MANVKKMHQSRRGLTIIEVALTLLMLITLFLGVIEYGWMFYKSHQLANAVRQGARVGARPSSDWGDVTTAVNQALLDAGIDTALVTDLSCSPANPESTDAGETFTVNVELDYDELGLHMPLVPTPSTLKSAVTMAREGP